MNDRDGLVCVWCKRPFVNHSGAGVYKLGVCKSCISNPRPLEVGACCCAKDKTVERLIRDVDRLSSENHNLRVELNTCKTISAALDTETLLKDVSTRQLQEVLAERWQAEQDEWDD